MIKQIQQEIENYKNNSYMMPEGYSFSAYKLLRRIGLYKAQIYPTGKTDSQGNYKYWFDVITPRVNSEVKNIDFNTSDIELFTDNNGDNMRILFSNIALKDYLAKSGEANKLNEGVEQGSEWGNLVWKKIKGGYKILELNNVMVLNQAAKTLEDSDVIEYELMVSSDLRKRKDGPWDSEAIERLLKAGKPEVNKSNPEFHIYERNGEISEKEYRKLKNKEGGSEDKYLLAKVITGGTELGKPTETLFCDEITNKPYKEFHRSTYTGTWIRRGMYEILMDIQTRANEIGNQIARGLEYASKTVFTGKSNLIAQNIITDLKNGDYIKAEDLKQVEVRMNGLDQLMADWNRLMQLADSLANSYEVVTGENLPARTAFKLAAQQNMNANKLFTYIRQKLGIAFGEVINEYVLPNFITELDGMEILRLTSEAGALNQYYEALIESWYVRNLLAMPPHDSEMAINIKMQKLQELLRNKETTVKLEKKMWKDFLPKIRVSITGENYALESEMDSLNAFISLEQDPIRRTALIEMAMKKKNINIASLPKTPPAPPTPQPQPQQQSNGLDQMLNSQPVA